MKHVHHAGMSDKTRSGFLSQFQFTRAVQLRGTFFALLAICFAAGPWAAHAAQPSLRPLVESGKWPAWPRGQPVSIAVDGNHAYVAEHYGLGVFDVSDPNQPKQVGSVYLFGDRSAITKVQVAGNHAFVARGEDGMYVVDIRNPARPKLVGRDRGYCADFSVSGSLAYVAGWNQNLRIVDISNPAAPRQVGGYTNPFGERFNTVAVSGNLVYVASEDYTNTGTGYGFVYRTHAIVVSNPSNTVPVVSLPAYGSMFARGSILYLADSTNGLQVIDMSDPASPVEMARYELPGVCRKVIVSGDYAYLGLHTSGLEILDVSDPSRPSRVATLAIDSGNFTVAGRQVYVVNSSGWEIIDLTNFAHPTSLGRHAVSTGYASGVAVSGQRAYLADGSALRIVDIQEPHHSVLLGECNVSADAVAVTRTHAFVGSQSKGLQVVDVSDPPNCRLIAADPTNSFGHAEPVYDVAVSGHLVYLARDRRLSVVNVENPAAPVEVGSHSVGSWVRAVYVTGDRVYLAAGTNGFVIVDVTDPTNCVRLGQFALPGSAADVVVSGNRAYVTYGGDGDWDDLEGAVLDVSDPAHIDWGSEFDDAEVFQLAVSGNHLYATSLTGTVLRVFDLNDPHTNRDDWQEEGIVYDIGWPTKGIAVANGVVYVAAGPAGLMVIPTIPDVQFTVRVEADPGSTFTLEAATNLSAPNPWSALVTTNVSVMPFDYVDYDVKVSEKPRKLYRVRQP